MKKKLISRIAATIVALGPAVLAPAAVASAAFAANVAPHQTVLSETDCFEVSFTRPVVTAEVAKLVPDQYGLPATPTMSLLIYSYTCRFASVDGQPQVGRDKSSTVTVGAVQVTSINGQLPTEFSAYVLWYGTNNPVQFAKLQQSGWPVTFQPRTTSSVPDSPVPGDVGSLDFSFRGGDINYDLQNQVVEPVVLPADGYISFWTNSPDGRALRLLIHNVALSENSRTTSTTGQLSGIVPLQPPVLTNARFNTIPQPGVTATLSYLRGSWESQLLVGQ